MIELQNVMIQKKKTLAIAESCTGGAIAAAICSVPDASQYFVGGVVAYSDRVKKEVLGVKSLESGAVSEEVVKEMAKEALQKLHVNFSIAVSGIAGPSGGTREKPVGTVWCAIASDEGEIWTGLLPKMRETSREMVIEATKKYVLENLWRYVEHGKIPFE